MSILPISLHLTTDRHLNQMFFYSTSLQIMQTYRKVISLSHMFFVNFLQIICVFVRGLEFAVAIHAWTSIVEEEEEEME